MKFLRVQFIHNVELDYNPVGSASIKDFTIVLTKGAMVELMSAKTKAQYLIPMANVACLEFEE